MPPRAPRLRPASGFTLIELLVATAVFVIGFAAVYTLFLAGMRFRKLADDIAKTSTLATTLLTEVYLDSGNAGTTSTSGPALPSDYNGCGNPAHGETASSVAPGTGNQVPAVPLYGYLGVPGAVYRLTGTTDILGQTGNENATALVTHVLALCPGSLPGVTPSGTGQTGVWTAVGTEADLERNLHLMQNDPNYGNITGGASAQTQYYEQTLVARGIAMDYTAVIIRQPHWLPLANQTTTGP